MNFPELSEDILINLLSFLPADEVEIFKSVNRSLTKNIEKVEKDLRYWKIKVEKILGKEYNGYDEIESRDNLVSVGLNWKNLYEFLEEFPNDQFRKNFVEKLIAGEFDLTINKLLDTKQRQVIRFILNYTSPEQKTLILKENFAKIVSLEFLEEILENSEFREILHNTGNPWYYFSVFLNEERAEHAKLIYDKILFELSASKATLDGLQYIIVRKSENPPQEAIKYLLLALRRKYYPSWSNILMALIKRDNSALFKFVLDQKDLNAGVLTEPKILDFIKKSTDEVVTHPKVINYVSKNITQLRLDGSGISEKGFLKVLERLDPEEILNSSRFLVRQGRSGYFKALVDSDLFPDLEDFSLIRLIIDLYRTKDFKNLLGSGKVPRGLIEKSNKYIRYIARNYESKAEEREETLRSFRELEKINIAAGILNLFQKTLDKDLKTEQDIEELYEIANRY